MPGLGPVGNAYTITTLDDAIHAGEGWRRLGSEPRSGEAVAAHGSRRTGPPA
jgi:hypothetical protein